MPEAQEWLEKKYSSLEKKNKLTKLNIKEESLRGELVIKDFPNLREINCWLNSISKVTMINLPNLYEVNLNQNSLTSLIITDCPKIGRFNVLWNNLTNFDFLDSLDPEKLISLNIWGNNFPAQDLSVFSRFTNLQRLIIVRNEFYGSLKPLENLKKMWELDISGTHIDRGLEYLPNSLESFSYDYCQEIKSQLKGYGGFMASGATKLKAWKQKNVTEVKRREEIKKNKEIFLGDEIKQEKNYKAEETDTGSKNSLSEFQDLVLAIGQIQQLQEENTQLKLINQKQREKIEKLEEWLTQFLMEEIKSKQTEFEQLIVTTKKKIREVLYDTLEGLLEAQDEITKTNNSFASKQLEKAKGKLSEKLNKEELDILLEKQTEVTKLQIQLDSLQESQYEEKVEIPPKKIINF